MSRRLFVALPPPALPGLEAELAEMLAGLSGVRRTPDDSRHVTLVFLGDVDADAVDRMASAVHRAAAESGPVRFGFDRMGGFPGPSSRIVALTGPTPQALAGLAGSLRRELRAAGADVEGRPFRLHLTLARLRQVQDIPLRPIASLRANAEEIRLYESELLPDGAHYTTLARVPLRSRDDPMG